MKKRMEENEEEKCKTNKKMRMQEEKKETNKKQGNEGNGEKEVT